MIQQGAFETVVLFSRPKRLLQFFFFFASCVGRDIFLQDLATLATSLLGAIMVVAAFTTGIYLEFLYHLSCSP